MTEFILYKIINSPLVLTKSKVELNSFFKPRMLVMLYVWNYTHCEK